MASVSRGYNCKNIPKCTCFEVSWFWWLWAWSLASSICNPTKRSFLHTLVHFWHRLTKVWSRSNFGQTSRQLCKKRVSSCENFLSFFFFSWYLVQSTFYLCDRPLILNGIEYLRVGQTFASIRWPELSWFSRPIEEMLSRGRGDWGSDNHGVNIWDYLWVLLNFDQFGMLSLKGWR